MADDNCQKKRKRPCIENARRKVPRVTKPENGSLFAQPQQCQAQNPLVWTDQHLRFLNFEFPGSPQEPEEPGNAQMKPGQKSDPTKVPTDAKFSIGMLNTVLSDVVQQEQAPMSVFTYAWAERDIRTLPVFKLCGRMAMLAYVDRRAVRKLRDQRRKQEVRSWLHGSFPLVDENKDPYIVAVMIALAQQSTRGSGIDVTVVDVAPEPPNTVPGMAGGQDDAEPTFSFFLLHSAYIPSTYLSLFEEPYKAPESQPQIRIHSQYLKVWPVIGLARRLDNVLNHTTREGHREEFIQYLVHSSQNSSSLLRAVAFDYSKQHHSTEDEEANKDNMISFMRSKYGPCTIAEWMLDACGRLSFATNGTAQASITDKQNDAVSEAVHSAHQGKQSRTSQDDCESRTGGFCKRMKHAPKS
ncbi:hypothetical protein Micbo1qcDRAFT_181326 [Microdochium bolleyi]|uniref:Uncharacterized protein n=1 Tax=Microdochium bolleyi TaxID=196109 RepID=A0A136IIQ4_9PEZI|nr:hypothetical protein Micbo1qcDRAFT_181326 [Microdochium bolleyi]